MKNDTAFSGASGSPLVSVLIPCFNQSKYIAQCLDSVLEDDYPNLEIIIVDDGSTDESCEIISSWINAKGRLFAGGVSLIRQANQGLIKSLNLLVSQSAGDYFVLLAGDDRLLPGGIDCRVSFLSANRDLLAVFCDARGIDADGNVLFKSVLTERYKADKSVLASEGFLAMELILNWSVPGPVFMADKRSVDVIGRYSEEFLIEDRDYYLRLMSKGKLGYVDAVVADYRFHKKSMTQELRSRRIVQEQVARIEKERLVLFDGWSSVALYLSWSANPGRLYGESSFRKILLCLEVMVSHVLKRGVLALVRGLVRYRNWDKEWRV